MTQESKRILIVDDEEDLCEILQFNLESEGYETEVAFSAEEALLKDIKSFDLLLLDVMMGKMSGFKLIDTIRKELKVEVPVIFLTAKSTENDLLTGFNLGADDYISKPYSLKELIARVKVVLRRNTSAIDSEEKSVIKVENMVLNLDKKDLTIIDDRIELTRKEFEILKLFFENRNKVFSRDEILLKIWGDDVIVSDRTVDVNITRLRKKIKHYGEYLKNRPGLGYYFEV
ncbi:response regulator transcription factor [Plebeiibacterium sediminum]|uniref:Response regulator transcription factor n=1 Tax=Plebeiibacterium sediminum TaxID=2992112 RepID=A0AAE3SGI6_9BACT|nr:response regulator transcription factor [Plebeiobacterium sediminum]MCW3788535.1 response regulator transcription factor [Plebeiobacterium sediminum]